MEITQELLKELFDYRDGFLYWKITGRGIKNGQKAATIDTGKSPRYFTMVNYKRYACARLIFLFHKGYLPIVVDHINRNPLDDRIENLREATYSQNSRNRTSQVNSTSTYLGVSFDKSRNKWVSDLYSNGRRVHFKRFKTEIDAALAYNRAAVMYHKEFANLNIINA